MSKYTSSISITRPTLSTLLGLTTHSGRKPKRALSRLQAQHRTGREVEVSLCNELDFPTALLWQLAPEVTYDSQEWYSSSGLSLGISDVAPGTSHLPG